MSAELLKVLLEGRLVSGHPMEERAVLDDTTKQPKFNNLGEARRSVSVGIAIPKIPNVDWRQTEWGQKIVAEAVANWPNGEHQSPTFSWKVNDGDSTVPNRNGNKNCEKDGWPGHWVIFASGEIGPVRCFHTGKYQAHEVIQQAAEIKRGDYCHLNITVRKNTGQTPGMYVNPDFFVLDRPGVAIVGGETNVADAMANAMGGGGNTQQQTAANTASPTGNTAATPAHVMTEKAIAKGVTYEFMTITKKWTDAQLVAGGWMHPPGAVADADEFMAPPV